MTAIAPGTPEWGSRFLDWQKGERLLNLPRSDFLCSEYDRAQARQRLYPFLAPKTVEDALEAVVSVGWIEDTAAARAQVLQAYRKPTAQEEEADG